MAKILVVDDSAVDRRFVGGLLQRESATDEISEAIHDGSPPFRVVVQRRHVRAPPPPVAHRPCARRPWLRGLAPALLQPHSLLRLPPSSLLGPVPLVPSGQPVRHPGLAWAWPAPARHVAVLSLWEPALTPVSEPTHPDPQTLRIRCRRREGPATSRRSTPPRVPDGGRAGQRLPESPGGASRNRSRACPTPAPRHPPMTRAPFAAAVSLRRATRGRFHSPELFADPSSP